MSGNFKRLTINDADPKTAKPICEGKKDGISRICAQEQCKSWKNQNMCGILQCPCNKTHSNCYSFINFEFLKQTASEYQTKSMNDLFQRILKTLRDLVRLTVERYNNMLALYEDYSMPPVLVQVQKSLKSSGTVEKELSIKLRKYYDKFPEHQIPKLTQFTDYSSSIVKLANICAEGEDFMQKFYKMLFTNVLQLDKLAVKLIEKTNIQKIEKKKQQNKSGGTRSQSKNKSLEKK